MEQEGPKTSSRKEEGLSKITEEDRTLDISVGQAKRDIF